MNDTSTVVPEATPTTPAMPDNNAADVNTSTPVEAAASESAAPTQTPREARPPRGPRPSQDGKPRDQRPANERGARGPGGQRGAPGAPGNNNRRGGKPQAPARPQQQLHPVLLRLRELYPAVFGQKPLPLKLGTFHDIVAAHPEAFDAKELREALGQHTRSSRYLEQVATGAKRCDLQGTPVEDLAPEHVHQAIMEMSRRDRSGSREAAEAKVRLRLKNAFEASGLSRSEYAERVKPPIEEWNALLDHAYAEHGASGAKREALRRAYEASGQTPEQFASDYGLDVATVQAAIA
jgi:ProP effector